MGKMRARNPDVFYDGSSFIDEDGTIITGISSYTWAEIDAIKCSHDLGNTVDLRYNVQVQKLFGETGLRFVAQIDRGTGGTPVITPGMTAEGTCIAGDWYQMEYYIRRPSTGGFNNLTDGLFQVIMTNLRTLQRLVVLDQHGGIAFGLNNGQLSLFYHYLQYTGGFPAAGNYVLEIADVEYWNKPPNALILPGQLTVDALV